jgi:hypothetical protein
MVVESSALIPHPASTPRSIRWSIANLHVPFFEEELMMSRRLMTVAGVCAALACITMVASEAEAGRCCRARRTRCCGGYGGGYAGHYGGCNAGHNMACNTGCNTGCNVGYAGGYSAGYAPTTNYSSGYGNVGAGTYETAPAVNGGVNAGVYRGSVNAGAGVNNGSGINRNGAGVGVNDGAGANGAGINAGAGATTTTPPAPANP